MKKPIIFISIFFPALSAFALEDFNSPFTPDLHTQGLWHFDQATGDTISISWTVLPDRNYQLYYSDALGAGENWTAVPGSYNVNEGIATQVLAVSGGTKKRFFKVEKQD